MPTVHQLALRSDPSFSRAALNKSSAAWPITMQVVLQGERVLAEHFYAWAQSANPIVYQFVQFFGVAMAEVAKTIHAPNIDTQATYDSITAGEDGDAMPFPVGTGWGLDVGPTTEYAPFQEFGFTHYQTGQWIQNPFMVPAADVIDPLFTDAMIQLAQIAQDRRFFTGPAGQGSASSTLSSIRNALYSYSKFAGDIQVFGVGGLSRSRGVALTGARLLGDVNAGMRGAIGHRITRRVYGRFASAGITASVSATLRGPGQSFVSSSSRIYNRIQGRVFGKALRGL